MLTTHQLRLSVLSTALILVLRSMGQGGCEAPSAVLSTLEGTLVRICHGSSLFLDGSASTAAPGHSIEQWVWHIGNNQEITTTASVEHVFNTHGVFAISLTVVDESGCTSPESEPIHVLVSGMPDFAGSTTLPAACEGQAFSLQATYAQPPMVLNPDPCSAPDNGMALPDAVGVPYLSPLVISGQSVEVLTNLAQLGDICIDIEHSFLGDLVLRVICPNGQSAMLHQQGGGGTFLGDANDNDGSVVIPGNCFQYCFSATPEFGTMAAMANTNRVPVSQGMALIPGTYAPSGTLEGLLGCPLNGTWHFSLTDLWAADNGTLCGWCLSFGATPDSSFMALGPVLGTSPDSSYWSGAGVTNTPGQPGQASLIATQGEHTITYTVLDDYGCTHQLEQPFSVGEVPEPSIVNNTELGLLCAQPTGAGYTYQWRYENIIVVGAEGVCYTPPGNGLVSVTVTTPQGCSGTTSLLHTGISGASNASAMLRIHPSPNSGSFTLQCEEPLPSQAYFDIIDATGKQVHQQRVNNSTTIVETQLDRGVYFVRLFTTNALFTQRMVVE